MKYGLKRQKSIELAGRVDLGLVRRLRLAEHRGCVERVAPRAGEELGGAVEDRGALLPRKPVPVLPGLVGRLDRQLHFVRAALVDVGENVLLVVRHDRRLESAGLDLLAADDARDLGLLALHLLEAELEACALGRPGGVGADRLVDRRNGLEDSWCAHAGHSMSVQVLSYDVPGLGSGGALPRRGAASVPRAAVRPGKPRGGEAAPAGRPGAPLLRRRARFLRGCRGRSLLGHRLPGRHGESLAGGAATARPSRTGSSPPLRATRTRSEPPARSVRATASPSSCRAIAWSRRVASAATDRSAAITSAAFSSSSMLSEDVRAELAGIDPRKACCRLAELSRSSAPPAVSTSGAEAGSRSISRCRARRSHAGPSRFFAPTTCRVRSARSRARRSSTPRASRSTSTTTPARYRC